MELGKPLTPWWETIEGARFHLRPLTGPELVEVFGSLDRQGRYMSGLGVRRAFELGLIGWEDVTDGGQPVPFSPHAATRLGAGVISDIGNAVINTSVLTEGEEKNFASPPRSGGGPTPSAAETPADAGGITPKPTQPASNGKSPE